MEDKVHLTVVTGIVVFLVGLEK